MVSQNNNISEKKIQIQKETTVTVLKNLDNQITLENLTRDQANHNFLMMNQILIHILFKSKVLINNKNL